MSTRGAIARLTGTLPPRFRGRYHHWDSYPTGLGRMLWHLYHGHFQQDLNAMLRLLLDEHPAGWNTIVGKDFNLLPEIGGFGNNTGQENNEGMDALRPQCYCHGDQSEEAWEVTEQRFGERLRVGLCLLVRPETGTRPDARALVLPAFRPEDGRLLRSGRSARCLGAHCCPRASRSRTRLERARRRAAARSDVQQASERGACAAPR